MDQLFLLISEYFWLLALGMGCFNYWKAQEALPVLENGEQSSQARAYLNKITFFMNLPWVVMGFGHISGYTPHVWSYFRPQDGNPFVMTWLAVVFGVSLLYAWWVCLAGGAERVRELKFMKAETQSVMAVKAVAILNVLAFPLWVFLVISTDAQVPLD